MPKAFLGPATGFSAEAGEIFKGMRACGAEGVWACAAGITGGEGWQEDKTAHAKAVPTNSVFPGVEYHFTIARRSFFHYITHAKKVTHRLGGPGNRLNTAKNRPGEFPKG
jgi:hypothetical protein